MRVSGVKSCMKTELSAGLSVRARAGRNILAQEKMFFETFLRESSFIASWCEGFSDEKSVANMSCYRSFSVVECWNVHWTLGLLAEEVEGEKVFESCTEQ